VRPLVDLAFEALFGEIFYHLHSCHDQNNMMVVDDDSGVISLQQQVSDIREKLDPFLIGPLSKFREKLISEFTKGRLCDYLDQVDPDVCLAFFDALLDDSFKECDASSHATSKCFSNLNNFLEVLALRSPKLESVMVRSDDEDSKISSEMGQSCVQSLKKFTHLTSLTILWTAPYDCLNFFRNLSDSCPKLSKLDLGSFYLNILQLFALMFGPKHDQLPMVLQPQYLRSAEIPLHKLEFHQESLTSICKSLKEFGCKHFCNLLNKRSEFWTDPSVIAFILRHFRNLQKLSHNCSFYQCEAKVSSGVVALLDEALKDNTGITSMALTSETLGVIHLTINAPFRGITLI